jgi:methylglyoxal synthase
MAIAPSSPRLAWLSRVLLVISWVSVAARKKGRQPVIEDRERMTLALIAHDGKKQAMLEFARQHQTVLERYDLIATNTTGRVLRDELGLAVTLMLSGPLGGDAQIAAQVAEGRIEAVFFFIDPLAAQPHDPDINGLLRICNVHNVPLATNAATASFIISGRAL